MRRTRQGIRNLDDLGPKKYGRVIESRPQCRHSKRVKRIARREATGARLNILCAVCHEILSFEWTENRAEIQKLLTEDSQITPVGATIPEGGNR